MSKDTCPACNQPWEDHDFGVPAPYCPAPMVNGKAEETLSDITMRHLQKNVEKLQYNLALATGAVKDNNDLAHQRGEELVSVGHQLIHWKALAEQQNKVLLQWKEFPHQNCRCDECMDHGGKCILMNDEVLKAFETLSK